MEDLLKNHPKRSKSELIIANMHGRGFVSQSSTHHHLTAGTRDEKIKRSTTIAGRPTTAIQQPLTIQEQLAKRASLAHRMKTRYLQRPQIDATY
jgi:hypothetical protein